VVDWNTDLHDRCARLQRKSAALQADSAALRLECTHIQAREAVPVMGGMIYDVPSTDPHDAAKDALRLIRAIIDPFPLEWQMAIVKALTARALVKAYERTRPAPAVISA
jgi:hypothetical protein